MCLGLDALKTTVNGTKFAVVLKIKNALLKSAKQWTDHRLEGPQINSRQFYFNHSISLLLAKRIFHFTCFGSDFALKLVQKILPWTSISLSRCLSNFTLQFHLFGFTFPHTNRQFHSILWIEKSKILLFGIVSLANFTFEPTTHSALLRSVARLCDSFFNPENDLIHSWSSAEQLKFTPHPHPQLELWVIMTGNREVKFWCFLLRQWKVWDELRRFFRAHSQDSEREWGLCGRTQLGAATSAEPTALSCPCSRGDVVNMWESYCRTGEGVVGLKKGGKRVPICARCCWWKRTCRWEKYLSWKTRQIWMFLDIKRSLSSVHLHIVFSSVSNKWSFPDRIAMKLKSCCFDLRCETLGVEVGDSSTSRVFNERETESHNTKLAICTSMTKRTTWKFSRSGICRSSKAKSFSWS